MASIFATGLLTLAACSNDENDPIGGSDNGQEGVKTWARLDIKVGGPVTRATTVPAGTDDGKIHNINVYVFNDAGQFEATTDLATPEDAHNTVHSTTLALTSGKKKVYVVANLDPAWMPANVPATQTAFEALFHELCETPGRRNPAVTRAGDHFSDLTGGADGSNGFLMSNVLTGVDFTLHAGVSKEQAGQASNDPDVMAQNNHLQVTLFRASAKIQVSYADANVLTVNSVTTGKPIAILDPASLRFAIRNLPKSTYMFLHNRDNGFLTPHYTATNVNSPEADFAAIFDDAEPIDQAVKLVSDAPVAVYVPENANQTPMVGNTTYAIIKATLRPMADVMINDIEVTGKAPNLTAIEKFDGTNYAGNTDAIPDFFTANNKIFTLPKNSSMTDDERAKYGFSLLLKDYLNSNGKSQFLLATEPVKAENEGDVQHPIMVYYTCEAGTSQGIYKIAQIKKYVKREGETVFTLEDVKDIRFLQYVDGAVHYRVNIEDNEDGKTDSNNLYYSVMRNRFYKVNINSVSAIGTPSEDGSSSVDPTDPVNSKTYMQAHITVEPWRVVDQNADLGI